MTYKSIDSTGSFRLLDLYCGGGGAAMGYHRAGFEVVGVDIANQPRYPFTFIQADAFEYLEEHGHEYDVIHASPPCQRYSVTKSLSSGNHPMLIEATRAALERTGKPYIIENVPGAPLINPLMLCGTMFGLRVIRHRLFETNWGLIISPASCNHWGTVSGNRALRDGKRVTPCLKDFDFITVVGHDFILADARIAMGIDWMGQREINQAIPPAYTLYIGRQLITVLNNV